MYTQAWHMLYIIWIRHKSLYLYFFCLYLFRVRVCKKIRVHPTYTFLKQNQTIIFRNNGLRLITKNTFDKEIHKNYIKAT